MNPSYPEAAPASALWPRPVASFALLGLIWLVFAGEVLFPAGAPSPALDPSIRTLIGWGAMSKGLVVDNGEPYRLLTAALLHGGPLHIIMNSIGLFAAGRMVEPLIGRAWYLALFVIGALGGGLASISFNPPMLIAVGASGAIMGLFGFSLVISRRFPPGEVRKAFLSGSMGALVPTLLPALLPLASGGSGMSIDHAAHIGGAVAGAVLAGLFLLIWRRDVRWPPARAFASIIALIALLTVAYGAARLKTSFGEQAFVAQLMSEDALRRLETSPSARAIDAALAAHPGDPRLFLLRARLLIREKNLADAETAARTAVQQVERYPKAFVPQFRTQLRFLLVGILVDQRKLDAARQEAQPLCSVREPAEMMKRLQAAANICPR
ncbi:MAG: rhomboid family intramembrane serine protease [Proteobacteria bacterium]|nr:rhomboid family intramembrane serine protease [Pseudomonadota bacterium]